MASSGGREELHEGDEVTEQGAFVDINVTPLVDIMLVLLVILMATSTAILEAGQGPGSGFQVQLPEGSSGKDSTMPGDEIVIAVSSDGTIILRGEQVSFDELQAVLQAVADKDPSRIVLVQADEDAKHRHVVRVMETARKVGLKNLAIATRNPG